MTGGGRDRGVSTVIGFILVFSFLIIAFTIYQGIVVPDQNRVVEFDHNQEVQGQMQDLRNAIMSAALGGSERTVSLKLGAEYPMRTLAQNLGYSGGNLRTSSPPGTSRIVVANATAVDRYGETGDFWNGSAERYETKDIVYEPVYSRYSNAPVTIYENTLTYNRFGGGTNLSITGESLVDGKRITIVTLVGDLSEGGKDTVSVDPEAISASTQRISIRNESHPVNVTIPTRVNASWWHETLRHENVTEGGHVTKIKDTGENQVSILLEADTTYTLRMAKIGVGSSALDESVEYLTLTERPSRTVFTDSSHSITVQARDRFNNPVDGVQINASVANSDVESDDGTFTAKTITTSTDGRATFNYTAPDSTGREDLRFNVTPEGGGHSSHEVVWVNLSVERSGDGGNTEDVNPSGSGSVLLESSTEGSPKNIADLAFNNTKDSSVTIEGIRVAFYYADQQDQATSVESFGASGTFNGSNTLPIGDPLTELDSPITLQEETPPDTISIDFNGGNVQTGGDFFILVLQFESGGTSTYFVSPSA